LSTISHHKFNGPSTTEVADSNPQGWHLGKLTLIIPGSAGERFSFFLSVYPLPFKKSGTPDGSLSSGLLGFNLNTNDHSLTLFNPPDRLSK
jgi:hypothetical protein